MDLITFNPKKDRMPDVLCTKSALVEFPLTEESKMVIEELKRNLNLLVNKYGNTRGVGLSANQIGVSLSIAIVNFGEEILVLINPKLINKSDAEVLSRIGCLSFFNYRGMVRHPKEIEISFKDINGKQLTRKFGSDEALIVLHEIDHLNGISLTKRSESCIFIPREIAYPSGSKTVLKNYGFIFAIRKYLYEHGIDLDFNPQTDIQYYSQFFREKGPNISEYIFHSVEKRKEMIDLIKKYTPNNGRILEAGCGTSSHSVYLSKQHYQVTAIDIEKDMLQIAKKFNEIESGTVTYVQGDIFNLPFKDNTYDTVFSHGVLEHFSIQEIISVVNESMRVANTVIISVPTIFDISNNLMGDEILRSIFKWKSILKRTDGHLREIRGSFPFHPTWRKIQKIAGRILDCIAPVIVLVVSRK